MKVEFDEIGIKDEIELMNIERQMQKQQLENKSILGFNIDSLYDTIDNNIK